MPRRQPNRYEDDLLLREEDLQLREEDLHPPERHTAPAGPAGLFSPVASSPAPNGGAWTIPLICLGIGIIAMCLIVPAADENRRLVWEREKLAADLAQIEKQIAINDEFLARLASDPGLAERLAQRQMKMVREGTSVLELPGRPRGPDVSPFELVTLPPPAPLPEYRPIGGKISQLFLHPKARLYMLGIGLIALVAGVILGSQKSVARRDSP